MTNDASSMRSATRKGPYFATGFRLHEGDGDGDEPVGRFEAAPDVKLQVGDGAKRAGIAPGEHAGGDGRAW